MFSRKLYNNSIANQQPNVENKSQNWSPKPSETKMKWDGLPSHWHGHGSGISNADNTSKNVRNTGFMQLDDQYSPTSISVQNSDIAYNNPFTNSLKYYSCDTTNDQMFSGSMMEDGYEEKSLRETLELQVNYENPLIFLEDFEKIADGTTSIVCKAKEIRTRRTVVVKRLNLSILKDKELVVNELTIMKKVNHPNIIQYIDSFLLDSELWIVMEYMDGGTLADVVASSRMIEQQIATVSKWVLEALAYLHDCGIIHRDLKSDCVLMRKDGPIKLSDFGFSIQLTPELPRRRSLVGTPYWMSPEVISREPYNTAADIWSFGIIVCEMVDGEPPHFNDIPLQAMRKIKEEAPPKMANLSRVSPMLQGFVEKMLVKDPTNRLSASELLYHPFLKKAVTYLCLLPLIKN